MGKNGTDERTDWMTDRRTDEVRRAIPDKTINGAGLSWSQIFMKLSEYVKVVTLSKCSTLFFSNMHGSMATRHKDISLQNSKMTN